MTIRAAIAIGSNIDPAENLPRAIRALRRHRDVRLESVGGVYESAPVGNPGGPPFWNSAVVVTTALDPEDLRAALRSIEAAQGRIRTKDRNAPRSIDLDIALIEGFTGTVAGSLVPDPEIEARAYLALPLAELVPAWTVESGATVAEVAAAFKTSQQEIRHIMSGDLRPISEVHYADESRMEAAPDEVYDPVMESTVRSMLEQLGEDPDREGLVRTPLRVAKAMDFLTSGYTATLEEVVGKALFESTADEMVVVRDVEFYSMCEHHMLPFFGKAHVAYLPKGKIIGLSKIARIVDLYARRLQVQENLTCQIAAALDGVLEPHGVAVVMEGSHFCMMMRGVQKQGSVMTTSAMRGSFKRDSATRSEFMGLIRG